MKPDLWWFIGLLIVFGLMWWQAGGPNQPASTAGPFLKSPLADFETSVSESRDPQTPSSQPGSHPGAESEASPYRGQVKIHLGNARQEIQPYQEYIVLEALSSNKEPVNISGWQLVNGAFRRPRPAVVKIPFGVKLFIGGRTNVPLEPIVLSPGAKAAVVTGRMPNTGPFPIDFSFQINKCSGYLGLLPNYRFYPPLDSHCPDPRQESGVEFLDEACFDFIARLSPCHTPKFERRSDGYQYVDGQLDRLTNRCRDFIQSHFNYNACVAWHGQDPDFWRKDWRVFLDKGGELWSNRFDRVLLYDQLGKLVDEVTYRD